MKKTIIILLVCILLSISTFFGVSRSIKIDYLTTKDNLKNVLDNLYNTFDMKDFYFQSTDKFNCDEKECKSSIFNNIGILSYSELKSYLYNDNPYFVLDDNVIRNVKSTNLVEDINSTTSSRVRSTLNVRKGIEVSGSGTYKDPWILSDKFNVTVFYESNGGKLNDKFKILTYNSQFGDLPIPTKTGHTFDGWYLNKDLTKLVEYKTIVKNIEDFYIYARYNINKYTIKLKVVNGSSNYDRAVVNYGDSATFNLIPDEKYNFVLSTVSCDKGTMGTILNNVLTISDVTQDDTCTIEAKKSYTCSSGELINDSSKGYICVTSGTYHPAEKRTCRGKGTCNCYTCQQSCSSYKGENKKSCLRGCSFGSKGTYPNCRYGGYCGEDYTYPCGHDAYYSCDNGWKEYSGTDSSLKCYMNATLN